MSAYAWALGRALQYTAATAIVALVISSLFGGSNAERFATTAYLAAIIAALVLILRWFVRDAHQLEPRRGPLFPAILNFSLWIAIFVIAGIMLASQPGSEVQAVAACFGLIGLAALVHGGAIGALGAKLSQGNRLSVSTRYAVAVAVVACAGAALVGAPRPGSLAKLAYAATVVMTLAVAASLVAPTRAGAAAQKFYARAAELIATPASALVFARTTEYGVATAVVAMLVASLLPQPFSERFATAAYFGVLFSALGIAMLWRLRKAGIESRVVAIRAFDAPLKFAGLVAALTLLGAAVSYNSVAETLGVVGCLGAIGAVIAKRARMTTA